MRSTPLDQWLVAERGFRVPAGANGSVDYVRRDGREVLQVKLQARGTRDLRDGLLQLSSYLAEHPKVQRGRLLIAISRSTLERTLGEWARAKRAIRPEIAGRLNLIAVVEGQLGTDPNEKALRKMGERFGAIVSEMEKRDRFHSASPGGDRNWGGRVLGGSWKHLEVEKVLLHRWLLGQGGIKAAELAKLVGCSFPTVQQTVRRLEAKDLIVREKGRSIALRRYPRGRWSELFMLAESIYPPEAYVDVTGDSGGPEALLKRLRRRPVENVAVGGVTAAREWDPMFDLNGTPRLDLVLHVPEGGRAGGGLDPDFVRKLDPALRPQKEHSRSAPVLVLHRIRRRAALFAHDPDGRPPRAGPVETLEHLNQMGLTVQAKDLLNRLRPEAKV